jgi:hypothetical protein
LEHGLHVGAGLGQRQLARVDAADRTRSFVGAEFFVDLGEARENEDDRYRSRRRTDHLDRDGHAHQQPGLFHG